MTARYVVTEGTPGYLPDTVEVFSSWRQATAYAASLARELFDAGYKRAGSVINEARSLYRAEYSDPSKTYDLGRVIWVEPTEEVFEEVSI